MKKIIAVTIITLFVLGLGWMMIRFSSSKNQKLVESTNRQSAQVPRILYSGKTIELDLGITRPDTQTWVSQCFSEWPCFKLPSSFAGCLSQDKSSVVVVNQSTCTSKLAEPVLLLTKKSVEQSEQAAIPQTTELVGPSFQKLSDAIRGNSGGTDVFCLDDQQMRHCVLTYSNGTRFLLRGDFYHEQDEDRNAFDGTLRSML